MSRQIGSAALKPYSKYLKLVQTLVCAAPTGLAIFHVSHSFFTPPLGTMGVVGVGLTSAIIGLLSYLPWLVTSESHAVRLTWVSAGCCVLLFIAYLCFAQTSIKFVDVPAQHRSILVSVGSKRTEFANRYYTGKSDEDMLMDQGHSEQDIHRLWTTMSITSSRLLLFGTYFATLALFNISCGLLGRVDQLRSL